MTLKSSEISIMPLPLESALQPGAPCASAGVAITAASSRVDRRAAAMTVAVKVRVMVRCIAKLRMGIILTGRKRPFLLGRIRASEGLQQCCRIQLR